MLGKEPKYGAYTQIYAGLDPGVTNGSFGMSCLYTHFLKPKMKSFFCLTSCVTFPVGPYGKLMKARSDLCEEALGKMYWEWAEKQVESFL